MLIQNIIIFTREYIYLFVDEYLYRIKMLQQYIHYEQPFWNNRKSLNTSIWSYTDLKWLRIFFSTDYLLIIICVNNSLSIADINKVKKVILTSITITDHEFKHI